MVASVVTANSDRMPMTTTTTIVWARATAWDPTTLRMVIAATTTDREHLQGHLVVSSPSANIELA